ncbi:30S ribosomal protein S17e [Candidatus Pacearchaeota archaeon ex4484_71]|nr:MAG: 30S ribosomal protein S17e [Candidatus Pacearchaeota archaeon ex4484_71]
MGKIKSKQIRRYSQELMNEGIEFSDDFEKNKRILGKEMPSKKMRNQMAGFLTRVMKQKKKEKEELETKE